MTAAPRQEVHYKQIAKAIILCFAVIRGLIACSMELGVDEAYYWLYSQDLKMNYYDHPPLVAFWIRLFTANLCLEQVEGLIRLGSVVGGAIAAWAIYRTAETCHSQKAGLYAVCLYTASIYTTVTAGIFIMPDTPQMVFYTLSLWMLAKLMNDDRSWFAWIAFGITAGLCIMSKVYGAFLWFGVICFALMRKRSWLAKPQLYTAIFITAIISSPILVWNIQYDFLTYRFHSDRIAVTGRRFDFINIFREIVQQVLYNNPLNVIVMVLAMHHLFKARKNETSTVDVFVLFNYTALPQVLLFLTVSLFRDTILPHWSGPAYVALIPIAAVYLAARHLQYARRWLLAALFGLLVFLVVWQYLIHLAPERVGARDVDQNNGIKAQVADRLLSGFANFQLVAETRNSWGPASEVFLKIYRRETSNGLMEENSAIVCYKWWGAQIDYYFGQPNNIPVIGLGNPNDLHEYLFTNAARIHTANLNTTYCIVPADDFYDVKVKYRSHYQQIEKPTIITIERNNKPPMVFYLYRLRGWKYKVPMLQKK